LRDAGASFLGGRVEITDGMDGVDVMDNFSLDVGRSMLDVHFLCPTVFSATSALSSSNAANSAARLAGL
jgi:hypothetical protein